jgi:hypothetical protein
LYIRLSFDGNVLMMHKTGSGVVPLTPRSGTEFWIDAFGEGIEFSQQDKNQTISILYRGQRALKIAESDSSQETSKLAGYAGDYFNEELMAMCRVDVKNGGLILLHPRHGQIALLHLHDDEYGSSQYFLGSSGFLRGKEGKVSGFWINTGDGRARKVEFIKH